MLVAGPRVRGPVGLVLARASRLAEMQARVAQERRQRRLRMIAAVVIGAVAVIAVAIAISSGSGSKGLAKGTGATRTVAAVEQLLDGIPQSGVRLGSPAAPVTMYYYGDLQCSVCQAFTLSSFAQLVSRDVRAGRVQVIYRALETATQDPQTFQTQQVAALGAGQQNHFWNYAELFYRQQGAEGSGYVTESYLDALARQVRGLGYDRWRAARSSPSLAAQVQTDRQQALAAKATGTPTLVFGGPRGQAPQLTGVPSYGDLQQAIKLVR
jgi:protein-disulfide isomerase